MTDQQHPITPPPELVEEWCDEWYRLKVKINTGIPEYVATQAARWGADQELEACCADIHTVHGEHRADWLRSMRRPKPPSLKEQALAALAAADGADHPVVATVITADQHALIRAALESLPS